MKRKRYTQEQVIVILKEYEAGLPAGELARRLGASFTPLSSRLPAQFAE